MKQLLSKLPQSTGVAFLGVITLGGRVSNRWIVITRRQSGNHSAPYTRNYHLRATGLLFWVFLAAVGSTLAFSDEEPQEHLRVLLLYSFDEGATTYAKFDQALRDRLNSSRIGRFEFYSEYLDLGRFPYPQHEKALADDLAEKYSNSNLDLVVPVSLPALEFTRKYGGRLFGATPVVFRVLDMHQILPFPRYSHVTGLAEANGLERTLGAALQLLPDTQQVVLVGGALPFERVMNADIRKELHPFEARVAITSLTDLPMDEVLRRLAKLSEHTIVLYMMMWGDSAGEYFVPEESLSLLSRACNAPIFGDFDDYLGLGIVGGDLVDSSRAGFQTGDLALRVLKGAKPGDIPIQHEDDASYKFDARQLRRWHISEDRLPPGSIVLYRQPSFWQLYKWRIVGVLFLVILETALVAVLLVQRRRRMLAEDKLRASEKASRRQLRHSPVAMLVSQGAEQETIFINDRFTALFGYTLDDVRSVPRWWELACPDQVDRNAIKAKLTAPRKREDPSQGEIMPMEGAVQCKDDTCRIIEFHFSNMGDANLVSFVDLTERQRAQQALADSERRYRDFIEHTNEGVWRLELEAPIPIDLPAEEILERALQFGYIAECNLAFAHALDFSTVEEVVGKRLADLVSPQDRERIESFLSTVRGGFKSRTIEFRALDRSGNLKHLSRTEVPIIQDGKLVRVWGITRDVTELRQAEEALHKSEERHRHLVESANDWVWEVDAEARYTYVGPQCRAILGYEPEEIIGKTPFDFMPAVEAERVAKVFGSITARRMPFRGLENINLRKDGHLVVLETNGIPVFDEKLGFLGYRGTDRDITERKRAERNLEQQVAFDDLMTRILSRFATCTPPEIDAGVVAALQAVAEFIGADHAFIIAVAGDMTSWSATHEWCAPNVVPVMQRFQKVPMVATSVTDDRMLLGEVVRVNTLNDHGPDDPEARCHRVKDGCRSFLDVPISTRTGILGYIGLHSHARQISWADEDVTHLRMVGDAVAGVLERKRVEDKRRETEERFQRMSDAAPVMIWQSGPDKLCSYFNKGWLDFRGRTMGQEIGNGWTEGVHPDDLPACLDTYSKAVDARESFRMEYRLRRYDGEYRWVSDSGVPRFEPDRTFAGYIGSCLDITDLKLAEDSLRNVSSRMLMAQEDERRRIARELHDDLSQQLALMAIDIEQLAQNPPASAPAFVSCMRQLWAKVDEVSQDIQRLSRQLHPSKLEDMGLVAAVRSYCNELKRQGTLDVSFSHDDIPNNLRVEAALSLYRIVQEALHNVIKHSGTKSARVDLRKESEDICLQISDSGRGFDLPTTKGGGLGLVSMRERARFVGGQWSIASSPSQGTCINVRVAIDSGKGQVGRA